MEMYQDGVPVYVLPEGAMCRADEYKRSPLDIEICPLGMRYVQGTVTNMRREWKMFETSIFCDKCGCGFSFPNVEPKWFMTKIAREKGWTIGKRHLCPGCNIKNGEAGERNERG